MKSISFVCYVYCLVGGTVDVATLSQIIVKRIRDLKTTPEELKDAFQVFDKQGTGMISMHDLKLSLTTLGERLSDEELDELIREVDQDGEGMVNYQGDDLLAVIVSVVIAISSISLQNVSALPEKEFSLSAFLCCKMKTTFISKHLFCSFLH